MADLLRSAALAGVPHAFSGRAGLEPRDVLPGAPMVRLRQVHSATVEVLDRPQHGIDSAVAEADALVTDRAGLLLTIVTADCAPVLLADREARIVGAAHAGWRGALGGILDNTVDAMVELGARPGRIIAAIGPCIHQSSYEVDAVLRDQFPAAAARFFLPGRESHWQFDLPGYVADRLALSGVGEVEILPHDTYSGEDRFHSYRRATHRDEATGGRQVSVVGLPFEH